MAYFSPKEILIGTAAIVWLCLVTWFAVSSDKTLSDVLINAITDIPFAIFVVFFIDYVNRKDREERTHSRQRAIARAVQKFYQNAVWIYSGLVTDGVLSSTQSSLPTLEMIEAMAGKYHSTTRLRADFAEQPTPYAAFFLCSFTGTSKANVYPPRLMNVWLQQLAREVDQLHRDIFQLDDGSLPDDVVDSLAELKVSGTVALCRDVLGLRAISFGYWPEDELDTATFHISVLNRYFAPLLGLEVSRADQFLKDAISNALNSRRAE